MKRWMLIVFLFARAAWADETSDLVGKGNQALQEGKPNDAIAAYEALADRGVSDASISFNRGLSYATRVRVNAAMPGDLGRAIHGFEEARTITRDPLVARAAESTLLLLRGEVARKLVASGSSPEVDRPPPLSRTLSAVLSIRAWNVICILASVLFAAALLVRSRLSERGRLGATIAATALVPLWAYVFAMSLFAERYQLERQEGVIVAENLRVASAPGMVGAGADALPEGARVEVLETRDGFASVEWGRSKGYVPLSAIRIIASR